MANSLYHWLPDCPASVLVAPVARGNGSIFGAQASSEDLRNSFCPRGELEDCRNWNVAYNNDDGLLLSHHCVYPDLWPRSFASHKSRKLDGDHVGWFVQFHMAAHRR